MGGAISRQIARSGDEEADLLEAGRFNYNIVWILDRSLVRIDFVQRPVGRDLSLDFGPI